MASSYPSFSWLSLMIVVLLSCRPPEPSTAYEIDASPIFRPVYQPLPLGAIKPTGWLHDQLTAQASGLTGHLDEFWPDLMQSGWKGEEGESWERGPYYLDGLLPLAYLLEDDRLIAKTQAWIEGMIASQQDDGWFGPSENADRWPLAVAMKGLRQYYEVSQDTRALIVIQRFFEWLHRQPPDWPDEEWRGVRAMEHAVTGYWLYRQQADPEILETIASIQKHSFDWSGFFTDFPWDTEALVSDNIPRDWEKQGKTAHVVNLAMAVKYPGIWYQQSKDMRHKEAVYQAIHSLDAHHGQVGGRFSGDEHLSGKSPSQGTELCAVVEYMYSLEELIAILGDPTLADRLEMLAYNALPGAMTPDCWAHQYDQQANQVLVSKADRTWSSNGPDANIYGLMPHYPCCLANFHQGWPKFASHMWMGTPEGGLAVISYGPNQVNHRLADGTSLYISQQTEYPFDGNILFRIKLEKSQTIPLEFRIPSWAEGTRILIRDEKFFPEAGTMYKLERNWEDGDWIQIKFPMHLRTEYRFNESLSLLRGPLYFSLRMDKEYTKIEGQRNQEMPMNYLGSTDWEISPTSVWNVALEIDPDSLRQINAIRHPLSQLPFADQGEPVFLAGENSYSIWDQAAPLVLEMNAYVLPDWEMDKHSASAPPISPVSVSGKRRKVELVPYGSARLRITEFPWVSQ